MSYLIDNPARVYKHSLIIVHQSFDVPENKF